MNQNIFVVYPSAKLGDFIWHVPFIKHISDITNKKVILITRKSIKKVYGLKAMV